MDTPHFRKDRINRDVASRDEAEWLVDVTSVKHSARNREIQSSTGKQLEQIELVGIVLDAVPDVATTCNEEYRIETVRSGCSDSP